MFTPSPMKFVLSQFDTTITLGRSAMYIYESPEEIPPIDASAVAIIYVNPRAFSQTFLVSSQFNNRISPSIPSGEYNINRYYTLPFYFNSETLFGANNTHGFINAMMDASYTENTIHIKSDRSMKSVTNWNGNDKNNLIPHDFMYYLASQLFDIQSSATIDNFVPFRNKSQLIEDIRTKCNFSDPNSDIFKNILTNTLYRTVFAASYDCDSYYNYNTDNNGLVSPNAESFNFEGVNVVGHPGLKLFKTQTTSTDSDGITETNIVNSNFMTDDVSNNTNICRTIYKQMLNDGSGVRFSTTTRMYSNNFNVSGTFNAFELPFIRGDSISFKLTINPAEGQHLVTGRDTPIPGRSYEIRMVLDENYLSLNTPVP